MKEFYHDPHNMNEATNPPKFPKTTNNIERWINCFIIHMTQVHTMVNRKNTQWLLF